MSATKQTHVCIKTNSRFHQNVQTYFYVNTFSTDPADCKSAGTPGGGRNTRGR